MARRTKVRFNVRKNPKVKGTIKAHSPELIEQIKTRAYYLALARGFAPGNELNDWLQAEQEILGK